jgi:hypothetical protein
MPYAPAHSRQGDEHGRDEHKRHLKNMRLLASFCARAPLPIEYLHPEQPDPLARKKVAPKIGPTVVANELKA